MPSKNLSNETMSLLERLIVQEFGPDCIHLDIIKLHKENTWIYPTNYSGLMNRPDFDVFQNLDEKNLVVKVKVPIFKNGKLQGLRWLFMFKYDLDYSNVFPNVSC